MSALGSGLNDEERKTCVRFEDYTEKIRTKVLRFTQEADSIIVQDPIDNEKGSLPTYFGRCMSKYDRQKHDAAQNRILLEYDFSHPQKDEKFSDLNRTALFTLLYSAEKTIFAVARNALAMIDEALANPKSLIVQGEGYFAKLERCENEKKNLTDERNRLNDELEKLSAEILGLRGQNEECRRQLEECERDRHIHPYRSP